MSRAITEVVSIFACDAVDGSRQTPLMSQSTMALDVSRMSVIG